MSASNRTITGKSHRKEIEIEVGGVLICTASYNPKSELFIRNVARVVQTLNNLSKIRGIKLRDLPEIDDEEGLDALDAASTELGGLADAYDTFIAASDKIIGIGVTETIIDEDDQNLTLFNKVFNPIFEEYVKVRKAKMDGYRADPQIAVNVPAALPELAPVPDMSVAINNAGVSSQNEPIN